MTLLETIANNPIRKAIGGFLSTYLYQGKYFEWDNWMFMHIIFGGVVMYFIHKSKWLNKRFCMNTKCRYILLFATLVLFEIIEFFFYTNPTLVSNGIFIPETIKNALWDVLVGLGGGFIVDKIIIKNKKKKIKN